MAPLTIQQNREIACMQITGRRDACATRDRAHATTSHRTGRLSPGADVEPEMKKWKLAGSIYHARIPPSPQSAHPTRPHPGLRGLQERLPEIYRAGSRAKDIRPRALSGGIAGGVSARQPPRGTPSSRRRPAVAIDEILMPRHGRHAVRDRSGAGTAFDGQELVLVCVHLRDTARRSTGPGTTHPKASRQLSHQAFGGRGICSHQRFIACTPPRDQAARCPTSTGCSRSAASFG